MSFAFLWKQKLGNIVAESYALFSKEKGSKVCLLEFVILRVCVYVRMSSYECCKSFALYRHLKFYFGLFYFKLWEIENNLLSFNVLITVELPMCFQLKEREKI